ncbi:MAG: glycosyltransferase family 4 protein [Paenibacillus sp.]|uniref:Spore coat protein SA n=1 Tax=Paenibacillus aquistagni TaxID=1852522 RepID=A0A1X7LT91_9BACL|nr:glycosyltransferase family 4 protein [Paenibacillus aquistagni]MBR2568398.1 glycosyltransferase family 4 protein [Paenibacillus sp.]NMM51968.1 glycosyltransferase family 4 protein [Paenibacillus aquistagni]SMG56707.1 spore coat protein SA [Paenibacillus aquistagni]
MRLPRVAVITPGTFPIPSGASSSVERVVEYVVGLASDRVEARIYARQWPGQELYGSVRGVPCERVRSSGGSRYILGVIAKLQQFDPDIIQVENRPRFVLTVKQLLPHKSVWLNLHSTTFMSKQHIPARKLRAAFRAAQRIFVNSRYLYNQVVSRAPDCADKVIVNPLGVDGGRFKSRWDEEGERRYLAGKQMQGWSERRIILYVGRLIPLKGVHHLIQLMPRLARAHPDVLLVVVGSASYGSRRRTKYVRRLERLSRRCERHIRFIPYVSHEEVPAWYALADMVVVPSVEREAFGLVNVEAMATGVPVVASRVGGIQEVVVDGVTGLLVPPYRLQRGLAQSLERLLANQEECERFGRAGVAHVEASFTWKRTAERWVSEVEQLR